jgi:hypothetical protein
VDNEELLQRAVFGKEVESFWGSRIGEYLQGRAQECYTAAIVKLKSVDPTDTKAVMLAQNEAWRAENFENWLTEVLTDGLKALELIQDGGVDE